MAFFRVGSVVCQVDEDELAFVQRLPWIVFNKGSHRYVRLIGGHHATAMHRLLMGAKPGQIVDHINGDTLDNRRSNLRFCTHQQNMWNRRVNRNNTTGLKGVSPANGKFTARIYVDGQRKYLGCFATPAEAHAAYAVAAKANRGEFCRF